VISFLKAQREELSTLVSGLELSRLEHRYLPDKWTVKEVFGHMIDTEWIFSYRMLRIARGDTTELPGMDQNDFMAGVDFSEQSVASMLAAFSGIRAATIELGSSFSKEVMDRTGTASGSGISVRAQLWILAGHCQHHINVLNERYL